jgi:hypothetical protein
MDIKNITPEELKAQFEQNPCGCATFNADPFFMDSEEEINDVLNALDECSYINIITPDDGYDYEVACHQLDIPVGNAKVIYRATDGGPGMLLGLSDNFFILQRSDIDKLFSFYNENNQYDVLFFRVGNYYKAYREQAAKVSEVVDIEREDTESEGKSVYVLNDELLSVVGELENAGLKVRTIEYHDGSDYVIPDVDLLSEEQKIDY